MWKSVLEFGVTRCDLPTMLSNVDFFLRFLTLKIDTRNETRIPIPFYFVTVISAVCYFYVYLISMAWFVVKCTRTGDVLPALIVFSLGVSSELGPIKLCCMFYYEFYNNLTKTLRVVKKRAMVFWIVIIGNGVIYIMKPILLPGRHLMEDIFIIYGLEPMFQSPNYEIAFTIMAIGVYVTVYLPANITAFLIIISGYVEAQMLAWSEELMHLWDDAEKHYFNEYCDGNNNSRNHKNVVMNKFVRQRLKAIIAGHSTNITVLRQMEDVFRTVIAVEFFLLIVGLIAELLGGLENTYMEIPFALMQVAMDCLTGQRLIDASLVFERAVYECRWEMMDNDNQRVVLMMLQNSQKPMTLTAGGMATLSFPSLMSVIRSIYSAYTTLRSTVK